MTETSAQIEQLSTLLDPISITILVVLMVWSLVWKGYALWQSARFGHKWWFVIMLIVNTVGILEIFYIFVIARKQKTDIQPM